MGGGLRFPNIDPASDNFFKTSADRAGGPIEPYLGFKEVYTEIYIKRARPKQATVTFTDANEGHADGGARPENEDEEKKIEDRDEGADEDENKDGAAQA
jgi:hypothetical protein